MDVVLRYRGRQITAEDIAFIKNLIARDPKASRRALSRQLCQAWGWLQPNGNLRDAVCRGLLLALERQGLIRLPPPRWAAKRPRRACVTAAEVEVDARPLVGSLAEIGPVHLVAVRRTALEPTFNALLARHHYLGYKQPVGEHLKYLAFSGGRVVACFAWGSAPRHLRPRDRFIGWSAQARQTNLRYLAYNSRFLILPWVKVPNLASHLLSRMTRLLVGEWQRVYAHPVYFAETFVDIERFTGSCYLAANWLKLGLTTGRGNNDQTGRANRSRKAVLGLPLVPDYRERLLSLA